MGMEGVKTGAFWLRFFEVSAERGLPGSKPAVLAFAGGQSGSEQSNYGRASGRGDGAAAGPAAAANGVGGSLEEPVCSSFRCCRATPVERDGLQADWRSSEEWHADAPCQCDVLVGRRRPRRADRTAPLLRCLQMICAIVAFSTVVGEQGGAQAAVGGHTATPAWCGRQRLVD